MKFSPILRSSVIVLGAASLALMGTASYAAMVPAGVTLAEDQTFTYRDLDESSSFDPQIVEDVSGSDIVRDLFEGLMSQDKDGNLVPGVAKSYEASDDKLTYTFHLRDNAKWSNGDPVTAGDFVYAWRRAADPATASPYAWYMDLMSIKGVKEVIDEVAEPSTLGVEAPDDLTFVVHLTKPLSYFPQMVTHATTFPTHKATIEKYGDAWTKPENIVSNGAYVLTEHIPSERSVRERNPMYWDDEHTVITKTTSLIINDDNAALTRYLAGELDRTEIPTGQYPRLKEEYPDQAVSFPRLCSYYYTFNVSDSGPEAFKDVRVRKALSYAIDRSVITDNVLKGGQFPAFTFTPGATAGFEVPDVPFGQMSQAERDAKAVELLKEAGYGPDHPLEFEMLYNTSEGHKQIATVMSQMWKQKLGVNATLANLEWKVFLDTRGNQDFALARGAWCGDYNEASTFLDLVQSDSGYNDGKYSNSEVDALLLDAKTSDDPAADYTKVEQIIADEMPIIPIYHYTRVMMMDPQLLPSWPVNNVEQNWYSKDLYRIAK